MKRNQIALQMYSLHTDSVADFPGTLKLVADMGYKNIEFAGFHDHDPKEIQSLLQDLGLTATSAHVGLQELWDDLDGTLAKYALFGKPAIIIPGFAMEWIDGLETTRKTMDSIKELSRKISAAGFECGFHNHWLEFERVYEDGTRIWDMLFGEDTKTDTLFAQIDLAWCKRGGYDPVAEMKRLGKNVRNLHIKDLNEKGEGVVVGTGLLDWASIMKAAEECGVSYYTIEVENWGEQRHELVKLALSNLQKLAVD